MSGPIFTTSAQKRTKTKAKSKARTSSKSASEKILLAARPYSSTIKGTSAWVGVSAAMVRKDVADPQMLDPTYWSACKQANLPVTDKDVEGIIKKCLDQPHTFVKQKTIRRNNDTIQKWIKLAVYKSDISDVWVFLDVDLGQAPQKVYGCLEDRDDGDEGPFDVPVVVNSPDPKKVTLVVAPYKVDNETFTRVTRKLGKSS